jgi:hypothetical protein
MWHVLGQIRHVLGIGARIRIFLVRMQLGSPQPTAPFWEQMAKPA